MAVNDLVIRFSTNESLLSKVIRWRTGSAFSHVDLYTGGGFAKTSLPFEGVCYAEYPLWTNFESLRFEVTDWQAKAIDEFFQETYMLPYDWAGALGLGFGRDWQCADRWFCSEWVAMALVKAQLVYVPTGLVGFSPQDLYNLLKAYTA